MGTRWAGRSEGHWKQESRLESHCGNSGMRTRGLQWPGAGGWTQQGCQRPEDLLAKGYRRWHPPGLVLCREKEPVNLG